MTQYEDVDKDGTLNRIPLDVNSDGFPEGKSVDWADGWLGTENLPYNDVPAGYFPGNAYEPRNMANTISYVYLGKGFTGDTDKLKNLSTDQRKASSQNCHTSYFWASIVGGKSVRVDAATIQDPYIFIDAKWYDLKPINYYNQWIEKYNPPDGVKLYEYIKDLEEEIDKTIPISNIIGNTSYDTDEGVSDPVYNIKSLESDGSIVIEANGGRYWWGTNAQANGDFSNKNSDGLLNLRAVKFGLEDDRCNELGRPYIKDVISDPLRNGETYTIKDIEPGEEIVIAEKGHSVSLYQGKIEEDLSDLIPEGIIQIGCLTKCVPN